MNLLVVRMNEQSVKNKVIKELAKLKKNKGVYAFLSKSEDYQVVNTEIMKYLTKKNSGIYVTLNKTHCDLVEDLKNNKIDTDKILFIDNVEKDKGCGADNCLFLGGNQSLTALSMIMGKAAKQKEMKFMFFDSITTLLIYNKLDTAEKFIHYFINKVKNLEILMIIMSVEEEKTKKILPLLTQFCDGLVKI
ncbi:hypothetical protein HOI26_03790 [Candidatus Woesearchaeota archaeon]|nr:hypothetical protein [Candidatus Woesearchaeota archaeon]